MVVQTPKFTRLENQPKGNIHWIWILQVFVSFLFAFSGSFTVSRPFDLQLTIGATSTFLFIYYANKILIKISLTNIPLRVVKWVRKKFERSLLLFLTLFCRKSALRVCMPTWAGVKKTSPCFEKFIYSHKDTREVARPVKELQTNPDVSLDLTKLTKTYRKL